MHPKDAAEGVSDEAWTNAAKHIVRQSAGHYRPGMVATP